MERTLRSDLNYELRIHLDIQETDEGGGEN